MRGAPIAMLLGLAACSTIGPPRMDADAGGPPPTGGPVDAGDSCQFPTVALDSKLVRLLYIVPSDRVVDPVRRANLEAGAREAQLWLRDRMPDGSSFLLTAAPVEVVQSSRAASYFATNPAAGCAVADYYQCNVENEAFELVGALRGDPSITWMIYVDAEAACGQGNYAGAGVAVHTANDLRGLAGQPLVSCDGSPPPVLTRCRWIGGLLFMLLNALDVPFLAGCADADPATPCDESNILGPGFYDYPAASLGAEQINFLLSDAFIAVSQLPGCTFDCLQPAAP